MKQYLFKSRFFREELLRWGLIVALAAWALTATLALILKRERTILIGVSDDSSYLIQEVNPSVQRKELASFIKAFVSQYYSFEAATYEARLSRAGDFMSQELWQLKQSEILKMKDALSKDPLSQRASIVSIDEIGDGKLEVLLAVAVQKRLRTTQVRLTVSLKIENQKRTLENTWPYRIVEITDAIQ